MKAHRFSRKQTIAGPGAIATNPKPDGIGRVVVAGETGDIHEATDAPTWTCPKCRARKVFQRKRA
ncbi:MAG: hypothetical protein EPN40_01690 [Rhodanobacteraceae bacterium]|nr:MAG: hypothetical protein EPN40_01690 [Rhodanobacteraceae bacterium]